MHKLALVSQIKAATMTATTVIFASFLFIDDIDLIALSDSVDEMVDMVLEHMQHAVLAWEVGLHATGSALKPDKCSWSLAAFVWHQGKWCYATQENSPGMLLLPDMMGNMQKLT